MSALPPTETPAVHLAVAASDDLGETPLWCDRTNRVWWIDVGGCRLQSLDPASGAHEVYPIECDALGCLALTESGRFLVARDNSLDLFDLASGAQARVAEIPEHARTRLNDGRVDGSGRLWIGTLAHDLTEPIGAFYRVDPGGAVTCQFGEVIVTNGTAISPDQHRLWFTDTRRYMTWVFDLHADGQLSNRRVFADHTATRFRPDGAAVDADGCLWQALFGAGRILRYRPDGTIDRILSVPVTNPTCIAFGGRDLTTLYVTTARRFLSHADLATQPLAGALLAIEGVGEGLPENRFGA